MPGFQYHTSAHLRLVCSDSDERALAVIVLSSKASSVSLFGCVCRMLRLPDEEKNQWLKLCVFQILCQTIT